MLVYRGAMVLVAVVVLLIIIGIVLLVPFLFRLCYNKCKCCRTGCHRCVRSHKRMKDDWVSSSTNPLSASTKSTGVEESDGKFYRLFDPGLTAQIFIYVCIGFIFVSICALTDVPWYVIWIIFFLVWAWLYIDFLRRRFNRQVKKGDIPLFRKDGSTVYAWLLNPESRSPSKENFDAYEAAGISRSSIKRAIAKYLANCKVACQQYLVAFLVVLFAIVIVTGISTIFSSCMCIATSPTEISTYYSRRIGDKYCKTGEICNVYFTLADTEKDMIVNFHASERPDLAMAAYGVVSHTRSGSIEEWFNSYAFNVTATSFKMNTVRELTRYVNWADVTNLAPDTTYYFITAYMKDGQMIASTKEYMVRTVPNTGTYHFITGGDMSVDMNSQKLIRHASSRRPYFAIIGGDNAYDNGFKSCYLRWDKWFYRWDKFMTENNGGFTIPVILAIGNHETGGFGAEPGDDPYYTSYFPQQLGLQNVNPRFRPSYHAHSIGNDSRFIILDTDVVARMGGPQKEWLAGELAVPSKVKTVIYHGNIYPSADLDAEMAREGRKHWVPLFDQYNVSVVFENHLHLYKRTKPLKNNKVDEQGITYFGDGTWGVMANIVALSKEYYIEKVNRNQHFFYVTLQNYSFMTVSAIEKSGATFDYWEKQL